MFNKMKTTEFVLKRNPANPVYPDGADSKNITHEIHQFMAKNNSILLSMADELHLQTDGSFKPVCSIRECMKSSNRSIFTTEFTENIYLP